MSLRTLAEEHATTIAMNTDRFADPVTQSRFGVQQKTVHPAALVTWLQQSWDTSRGAETKQQAEVYLPEAADVRSGDVFTINGVTTVVTALGEVSFGLRRFTVEARKPDTQTGARAVL